MSRLCKMSQDVKEFIEIPPYWCWVFLPIVSANDKPRKRIESDRKKQQAYQQIVDAADQMERDRIRNIQEQEARNRARRHHGGGLFRYIVNPITNKRVSISSSLGKSIINNYLNTLR